MPPTITLSHLSHWTVIVRVARKPDSSGEEHLEHTWPPIRQDGDGILELGGILQRASYILVKDAERQIRQEAP